ncbi:unnamed protein product [Dicrocoelium dendriticum]|nr:unnamed protein product [Dicrocoelium dendriticum]
MPRRSGHSSEEGSAPRRTSARIAAAQAASPAKSPAKSPRRKRQSAESNKATSEDTESQRSQLKSESSIEELNGLDVSSSTKEESVADSQELPSKKSKTDEPLAVEQSASADVAREVDETVAQEVTEEPREVISPRGLDFEVIQETDVPAPNSAEVQAAVSVQGEDGQLLVDFVQVDTSELPSVTSVEVKQPTLIDEPASEPDMPIYEEISEPVPAPMVNSTFNGGHSHVSSNVTDDAIQPTDFAEPELQNKLGAVTDAPIQFVPAPAAGDFTADVAISETAP